jgi:hypothetical protein
MIRIKKEVLFLFIATIFISKVYADKLEDGFERLRVHDYFKAKEYFEKTLGKKTPGAAYGLSVIYSLENNPFFNLDSARKYILLSDSAFKTIKQKEHKYYSALGVSDSSIVSASQQICSKYYTYVQKADSIELYEHFLTTFSTCAEREDVIEHRNSAAFKSTVKVNTSDAYLKYTQMYPDAEDSQRAMELYQQKLFEEKTTDNSVPSYESFSKAHPESPYVDEADRMIYKLSTSNHSVEEYSKFARKYPKSKYSGDAWRQVYALSMKDFTETAFKSFKKKYPDYPFVSEMETDYKLQNYTFLPIEKNDKWGYINEEGTELIAPQFDDATLFSEGLAVVAMKDKFGYIGKSGKIILPFSYSEADPFHNGFALVLVDSLYGVINRKGEFVIKPQYEDISDFVEDVCIVVKNGKSGYFSKSGKQLTEVQFEIANDFQDGYAIVAINEKFGLINSLGKFVIEPLYDELISISKDRMKASNNEKWGVIDLRGNTIAAFIYDDIGEYSNGLALAALNGKYGYINEKGIEKIPLKYLYSESLLSTGKFSNGYTLLRLKNKNLLADTAGVITAFHGIEQYGIPGNNLIPVMKNKKWGFADMTGKIKIQPKFDQVESFINGLAVVKIKGLFGVIDTNGVQIIQPLYDNIILQNDYITVVKEAKFGALSKSAGLILPCAYRSIDMIGPRILRGMNEHRLVYVELSGRIIYLGGE